MAMMAAFMAAEILSAVRGSRYWSYSTAIGWPSRSVTVVVSGGSSAARSASIAATDSPT
jgi:hypothetical protein